MLSRLLYRDGMMLVVDKPAGLSVHRGPKGGASLEDYFDVLRFGLPRMPALAHRLDKDTSGCLVLGRHRKALALLGKLFKNGAIGKTYWAVVEGGPTEDDGRIDIPLGKLDEDRGWWMKPDPDGKPSSTTCAEMGFPILGDPIYGSAPRNSVSLGGPALHLHSREIVVPISKNKPPVVTSAPVPPHMREMLTKCGWTESIEPQPVGGT